MTRSQYTLFIYFCIFTCIWIFLRLHPFNISALIIFSHLNYGNFANDMQVNYTNFKNTSIFFDVFKFFYRNDLNRLFLHFTTSLISIYFFYRFFYRNLNFSFFYSLLAIICLYNLDHFLLIDLRSSIIPYDNGYQNFFAIKFIGPLLYYAVNKKLIKFTTVVIFSILVSIKTILLPAIIFILYIALKANKITKATILASSLIIIIICFFFRENIALEASHDQLKFMYNSVMERGSNEDVIHLQPDKQILLLFLSIPIYFFFIVKNNLKIKYLNEIILTFTILIIFLGEFYHLYLYNFLPDPRITAFSVVRNLLIYQLFFVINLIIFIKNFKTNEVTKIIFLGLLVNFNFGHIYDKNYYVISFFFILLFLSHVFFLLKIKSINLNRNFQFLLMIFFFLPNFYSILNNYKKVFNFDILIKEKIFYSDIKNINFYNKLKKISECKNEFQLLGLEFDPKTYKYNFSQSANFFSKKNSFLIDHYTVWNYDNHLIVLENLKFVDHLLDYLNLHYINKKNFNDFKNYVRKISKDLTNNENLYIIVYDKNVYLEHNNYLIKSCS